MRLDTLCASNAEFHAVFAACDAVNDAANGAVAMAATAAEASILAVKAANAALAKAVSAFASADFEEHSLVETTVFGLRMSGVFGRKMPFTLGFHDDDLLLKNDVNDHERNSSGALN